MVGRPSGRRWSVCTAGSQFNRAPTIEPLPPRAGPQSGPQLERHRTIQEVLRRADFNLNKAMLNLIAHAWQARGPGFESPMLHPRFELKAGGQHVRAPVFS